MIYSKFRGHSIQYIGRRWIFTDDGEPVAATWRNRTCGYCGTTNTPEGHDGCLGTLDGVMNACCGHGNTPDAYVQFFDGRRIQGQAAENFFRR